MADDDDDDDDAMRAAERQQRQCQYVNMHANALFFSFSIFPPFYNLGKEAAAPSRELHCTALHCRHPTPPPNTFHFKHVQVPTLTHESYVTLIVNMGYTNKKTARWHGLSPPSQEIDLLFPKKKFEKK